MSKSPTRQSTEAQLLRNNRKLFRRREWSKYRQQVTIDLNGNNTLPPYLREISLLGPLRRLVDRWANMATTALIYQAPQWRKVAATISMILHAVYVAVTRGEYERLDKPAAWANSLLLELHIAQPHGPRADRERAVRDVLALNLQRFGFTSDTPTTVVNIWSWQFQEELNLIDHIWDLTTYMREQLTGEVPTRFEVMLGERSLEQCRETAVALVRLLLRHEMWPPNKSKNYLKADIVHASRDYKRRRTRGFT